MLRRHVLAALAAGIAAGDDDAARAALGRIDWVLRGRAKRRLERALIDAAIVVDEPGAADIETARHVQRVAALEIAGRGPTGSQAIEPTDREQIAAAYAQLVIPAPSRAPIATVFTGLVAVALLATTVIVLATRPGPASRTYARPLPPPAAGAFKDGGQPLGDPAIEALLVGEFTKHILAIDADRRSAGLARAAQAKQRGEALRAHPAIAKSPALVAAWGGLLDLFDRWVSIPISSPEFEVVAKDVRNRARVVSDQLAALGIGYYLEGSVFTRGDSAHAVVYTYRVEQVVFVRANTKPRRVLSLRRLDAINLSHNLLGMESQDLGDPIVLLDQIDQHVVTHVLPALATGAVFPLADDKWSDQTKLGLAAGDAIRREAMIGLGSDAAATSQIATLLAERNVVVEGWRDQFEQRRMRMAQTRDLFLPTALLDQLDGQVPSGQLARVIAIEDELARLEAPRIAARCQELVATTVRHHEAQHGLDDDRASPLAYPDVLASHIGSFENRKGEPRSAAEHANAELSAYISQLANDLVTPQLTLWNTAQHAFTEHGWGTAESYVAVIVLEGLARQLGVPSSGPIIHDGMIDRARLAALVATFAGRPGAELRAAARALWIELYKEPLVTITD